MGYPIQTILDNPLYFQAIRKTLSNTFPQKYHSIWKLKHSTIQWQLQTFSVCYQRSDTPDQISKAIETDTLSVCEACKIPGHAIKRCPQTKIAYQKRRLQQTNNPRKDTKCGPYANLSPFHLLTDVLIPCEAFN